MYDQLRFNQQPPQVDEHTIELYVGFPDTLDEETRRMVSDCLERNPAAQKVADFYRDYYRHLDCVQDDPLPIIANFVDKLFEKDYPEELNPGNSNELFDKLNFLMSKGIGLREALKRLRLTKETFLSLREKYLLMRLNTLTNNTKP